MPKLEITLKQHTPLIHFQHNQEGATLRASEVKPKLDRFILTRLGENPTEEQINAGEIQYKKDHQHDQIFIPFRDLTDYEKGKFIAKGLGWLIGKGEHGAIDYKLKFVISNEPIILDIKAYSEKGKERPYPLYFGNIKKDPNNPDEYRKFSFLTDSFKAIFLCANETIKKEIKKNIAIFFLRYNFGTRQSKGFGSFYLDITEKDKPYYVTPYYKYGFSYVTKIKNPKNYRNSRDYIEDLNQSFLELYDMIELFYKSIRSGLQYPFYMKPMIFKYAKSKGLQWDKRSIKEEYYPKDLSNQIIKHKSPDNLTFTQTEPEKYLFKDLFGLSVLEEWEKPYQKKISKSNDHIDRFPSPIVFKPLRFGNRFLVNLFIEQMPEKFFGKKFTIKSNGIGNLSLKPYPDFDIEEFIIFALKTNLKSMLGDESYVEHKQFKLLQSIYDGLNTPKIKK